MNVKPMNYAWPEFYDRLVDLTKLFLLLARDRDGGSAPPRHRFPAWMNVVRAVSSEGWGRIKYHRRSAGCSTPTERCAASWRASDDRCPASTRRDPARSRAVLGPPAGRAPEHDPNAYLKSEGPAPVVSLQGGRRARAGAAVMAPIPAAPN